MTTVSFHWGATGALAEVEAGACAVVVDVLSFTTTLSVAVDQGTEVLPYPWRDDSADAFARERGAVLAVGRREAPPSGGVSLSPVSVRRSAGVRRLVLPSPNGSATSHRLAGTGATVIGACLRNAEAVGRWIAQQQPARVVVVAAGEQWPDGSLRPALEDVVGAGAVVNALPAAATLTPDAHAALAVFRDARPHLLDRLLECPSGQELVSMGFRDDVLIAAELDTSTAVPVLDGDAFRGLPAS